MIIYFHFSLSLRKSIVKGIIVGFDECVKFFFRRYLAVAFLQLQPRVVFYIPAVANPVEGGGAHLDTGAEVFYTVYQFMDEKGQLRPHGFQGFHRWTRGSIMVLFHDAAEGVCTFV